VPQVTLEYTLELENPGEEKKVAGCVGTQSARVIARSLSLTAKNVIDP